MFKTDANNYIDINPLIMIVLTDIYKIVIVQNILNGVVGEQ